MDKGLDPIESRSVGDFLQMNLVYDTLLHAQDDGSYKPGLALSYKVEGDNSVTLTLRPNLQFSDGTPLDATAVKFSIDRAVASKNTNLAPEINNVGSVDVVDPVTVKITMKTPTIGSFFELLAGRETMPVSPTAVDRRPHRVQHQARRRGSVHRHRVHAAVDHVAAQEPRTTGTRRTGSSAASTSSTRPPARRG